MTDTDRAPKDGKPIIARFKSYPIPLVAMWNKPDGQWVVATPQCCGADNYFENGWFDADDLISWRELC